MEISELKKGNIVSMTEKKYDDSYLVVCEIRYNYAVCKYTNELEDDWSYKNDIYPIKLTEDWLIEFQLPRRKIKTENPYYQYSIRDDFEIYCYMDGSGNCLFWGESSLQNAFFIIKCDSVHIFQNTYAVLNPHEKLTIKL